MTIQEAIKSGKPFFRPNWGEWDFIQPNGMAFLYDRNSDIFTPSKEDILAEDWEVIEQ